MPGKGQVRAAGPLGKADDLVRCDDAGRERSWSGGGLVLIEERLRDQDGITRGPGYLDRFLGPGPDAFGRVDICPTNNREAGKQGGSEMEFLSREILECFFQPTHSWQVGDEGVGEQIGTNLCSGPGDGVRPAPGQLRRLLVQRQRGVEVTEPAQHIRQVESHIRAQFATVDEFRSNRVGLPQQTCGARLVAGGDQFGRNLTNRAHRIGLCGRTGGGPHPVCCCGSSPVEATDRLPRRGQSQVQIPSIPEPCGSLGKQRVMEAHPRRRHLVKHAPANCRLETAGEDIRGAGAGHGEHRQRRPGPGHGCDRQRIPGVDVALVERAFEDVTDQPAPARSAQEFLDEQRIAAGPGTQFDRIDTIC